MVRAAFSVAAVRCNCIDDSGASARHGRRRWGRGHADRGGPKLDAVTNVRIALAQVNVTVGDLAGNAEIITAWTRRAAERGARVVVFPEMALTGYPVEDLALRASFVEASIAALRDVAERLNVEGLGGVAVVVGYLDRRAGLAPRTGLPAGSAARRGGRPARRPGGDHLGEAPPAQLRRLR